ncbi:G-box binding factor 1 [Striga asiatica]|uniref:G-box binding factor 1 n=1 Tax=Striga asiatica TaxID=4170 RepID=A0A5A7PBI1_STRAF|nr:G-box binding factor 1 [Striga asiatica]
MGRDESMKMEIENLTRERDAAKKEARALEQTLAAKELERLNLDENLRRCLRKCEDLQETVARLIEENKVSSDREKRAVERCERITAENQKIVSERNTLFSELSAKIKELKGKNLEADCLVGVYQEKRRCLENDAEKMGREIEKLKGEILEANKSMDSLKSMKMESDKAAELYKSRLENLSPRISRIEEDIADMLTVKVGDLAGLSHNLGSSFVQGDGGNLNFLDCWGKCDISGNGSTPEDAEAVVLSRGAHSASNYSGVSSKKEGDRNSVQPSSRENDAHAVKESCGPQSNRNPPHAEASNAVNRIDSDDEANVGQASQFSNRGELNSTIDKNCTKVLESQSSISKRSKRNQTDCTDDLIASWSTKKKRNKWTGNNGDNVSIHEKEKEVSGLTNDKSSRKWTCEADMLRAFREDEQLCMNAVCALYRQQAKSKGYSNSSGSGVFSPVDLFSGTFLAEYFLDGDKELKLKKSASEVKKLRPQAIEQCRKLATIYVDKLFAIYCSGEDPLFGQ